MIGLIICVLVLLSLGAFLYFRKADSEMTKALEELGKALDKKGNPLDK